LTIYLFYFRSTTASTTTTTATTESVLTTQHDPEFDPCLSGNHIVIANEPERSANHHLSLGAGNNRNLAKFHVLSFTLLTLESIQDFINEINYDFQMS
jgi:hypothetical protein